jgi:hypothetical protein
MALSNMHNVFPCIAGVGEERSLEGGLRLPLHLLSCTQNPHLHLLHSSSAPSSRSKPPHVALESSLPTPLLQLDGDLVWVRQLLGWMVVEYDGRVRCGTVLLGGL